MILVGPLTPNCIVDTFVASEKVGEGGPGDVVRRELLKERARSDLVAMAGTRTSCANVIKCCCLVFPFPV